MDHEKNENEGRLDLFSEGLDLTLSFLGSTITPVAGINAVRKYIEAKKANRFAKNLKAFLKESNKATIEQKESFKKEMQDNYPDFNDYLLLVLEELDAEEKAEALGKIQRAFFEGKLQKEEFMKFAKVLNQIDIQTFNFLISKDSSSFSQEVRHSEGIQFYNELMGFGLALSEYQLKDDLTPRMSGHNVKPIVVQKYKFTPLGNLLLDILIYNSRQPKPQERMERDWRSRATKKNNQ